MGNGQTGAGMDIAHAILLLLCDKTDPIHACHCPCSAGNWSTGSLGRRSLVAPVFPRGSLAWQPGNWVCLGRSIPRAIFPGALWAKISS